MRALALIGTDAALDALVDYATDWRQTVTNALVKAWDSFDRDEFAKRVFGNGKALTANRINSLDGFEHLVALESLTIWDTGYLRDISAIASLPKLKILTLRYCWMLHDLSPLKSAHSLENFTVVYPTIDMDLSALANLPNLQKVSIDWARGNVKILVLDSIQKKVTIYPLPERNSPPLPQPLLGITNPQNPSDWIWVETRP